VTFVHLEIHFYFTLPGGAASVTELAGRASADGMSHLALIDTNALYGVEAFGRACREKGVQPIIHKTGSIEGMLHDWGFTGQVDLFLLTRNVRDEGEVGRALDVLGPILLL
jgi:DNA polymerase III alpha subunit